MSTTADAYTRPDLARANEVRCAHAAIKRYVRSRSTADGRDVVASLLEHPTGHVSTLRIGHLLGAIRGLRSVQLDALVFADRWSTTTASISDRRVAELTDRQRRSLAARLRS